MKTSKELFRLFLFLVITTPSASLSYAGTIRDDRPDKYYQNASKNIAWRAVGRSFHHDQGTSGGNCSATLIAPQWVLGAAHCVVYQSINPFIQVTVGGQRFDVGPDDIFIHPDWLNSGLMNPLSGKGDIALYRLRYPALNGAPLPLYTGSSEVGQVGFIVGFGTTGTGRSGGVNYDGLPRAGQNMIDLASSTQFHGVEVGNERILAIDFDSPDAKSSACGSPNPLQAEYSTSFGDSGGPLLVYSGGRFRIAGITSGGLPKPGRNASSYGELATFTRVSPYANWIRRVMNGQEPSIYEAFSSGALTANQVGNAMAARRAREFAMNQRGLRTAVYVDRLTPNDGFPLPALFTSVKTYQPFTPDGLPPFLRSSIFSGSTQASPPRPIRETSCTPCESVTVVPFPEQHDVPSVLVRNDLR